MKGIVLTRDPPAHNVLRYANKVLLLVLTDLAKTTDAFSFHSNIDKSVLHV